MDDGMWPAPPHARGALTGSLLGGFPLLSLLGAGGMAEIYRSVDVPLQRDLAVKVLPAHLARDAEYVRRFRLEAQRVAALSHPHIVPVFTFGAERGQLYLVMPLLAGSLGDRLRREGKLEPTDAVRLVVQIAEALEAAHHHGLVHRDVKPENILLDQDGQALLSDFGIAREVEVLREPRAAPTLSASGLPVGTLEYMAPEQLRGAVVDERADLYSLGAVLFEALTGRLPHGGATTYEMVANVLRERPPSPAVYNPAIWPALAAVVLRALAPDPAERYPDMHRFVVALRHALLDRGASGGAALLAAAAPHSRPLALVPRTTRELTALVPVVPAGVPVGAADAAGARRVVAVGQGRFLATHWGDTLAPRQRRRAQVLAAAILLLVLALGATSGILVSLHLAGTHSAAGGGSPTMTASGQGMVPGTATSISTVTTTVPSASPSTTAARTTPTTARGGGGPAATATSVPTPIATPVPTPTATPLMTPTITVSSSPLNFQPYPAQNPNSCVATQKLTNSSAAIAHWTWTNNPGPGGWQYNTVDLSSNSWTGFPASLPGTTAAYSSDYIYIKAGFDQQVCSNHTTVATISVTYGTGTTFSVQY